MKQARRIIALMLSLAGLASPALAAGTRPDHSGILVWGFLGFCALIIVAQLAPAVLMMFGLAKGVAGKKGAAEAHTSK